MSNQDYHEMLDDIVQADVDYVRAKDVQYDSSWKKRGGVGAFFTIVRPWDRLNNFAEKHGYDLFAALANDDLRGPDGTALACIRDLRRYLLLVEANLVHERTKCGSELWRDICRQAHADERTTPNSRHREADLAEARPGTPADGGHHERLYDDVRPAQRAGDDGYRSGGDADAKAHDEILRLRRQRQTPSSSTTVMPPRSPMPERLEDGLLSPEGDVLFIAVLDPTGGTVYFNVDRRTVAADRIIEHLPLLDLELNHKEWTLQRVEYLGMYEWDGQANKYRLKPEFHDKWGIRP
jgi:hypothetical protein